jgi:hypothetical protein
VTGPALAQLDERLAQLQSTLDRTTESLVELDGDVTRQMLDASPGLTGRTAREWSTASAQLAGLWRGQLALNDVLAALRTERGSGSSLRRATLVKITEQLDGRPVVLSLAEERRSLTDGLHRSEHYSIDDVVGMMSLAFDAVTATLRAVCVVWSETVPRLQGLEASLVEGERATEAAGARSARAIAAVHAQLSAALELAAHDPLALDAGVVAPIESAVDGVCAAAREATEARGRFERDSLELGRAIDACETTIAAARARSEETAAKIVIPSEVWEAQASVEAELSALRAGWLDGEQAAEHDLATARGGLQRRRDQTASLTERAGRLAADSRFTVAARDELRGRLDAYRAKAQGRGRAEDLELDALYTAAETVLYSAPCDLAVATNLVRAYQEAVGTATIEDRR